MLRIVVPSILTLRIIILNVLTLRIIIPSKRKTQALHEDGETPVQTDALLYVNHTLLMVGILEEVCPLHHPHLLPPGALLYTLAVGPKP